MKYKKVVLISSVAFLGLGSAFLLGAALVKHRQIKQYSRAQAELRRFFGSLGEIEVLYIKEFVSDSQAVRGGIVMSDGKNYCFIYRDGQVEFWEE